MRDIGANLLTAQQAMELDPLIRITLSDPAGIKADVILQQDRILQVPSQIEHPDSQTVEIVLKNSDNYFTDINLKGWDAVFEWGLVTPAGNKYSTLPPFKVLDQQLSSSPGVLRCYLYLIGIPNRLAEDKASKDYLHHWSDTKKVKAMITEIADGTAVNTELTEEQTDYDPTAGISYANLDDTLYGYGQRLHISATVTKLAFRLKRYGLPGGSVTFKITSVDTEMDLGSKTYACGSISNSAYEWVELTFDSPVAVDEDVWIWIYYNAGDATNYIIVSYSSVAVKPDEWLCYIASTGSMVEVTDQDCLYRYKYTATGIDCFALCEAYEVVYDPYGTHTGGTHATILTDSAASFKTDALIGQVVYNVTDGSSGTITDNDATHVTVSALSGGSDDQWENGDSYTIEDSLLDSYMPADAFRIQEGSSRLDQINKLLHYTGGVKLVKADGKIHIFVPTTSGAVYDYEYSLDTGHTFFGKANREALVIPSRIVVHSYPDDANQWTGEATDAVSHALLPITGSPIRAKLTSHEQAASIAAAKISRLQIEAQRGSALVPNNLGSEVYDYVKITDSRESNRVGNLGYIRRSYNPDDNKFEMAFSFGKVPLKRVPGTKPSLMREARFIPEPTLDEAVLRWGMIKPSLEYIEENFEYIWGAFDGIVEILNAITSILGYGEDETPTDEQIQYALVRYLKNILEDLSPQLGADLDVNGHSIKELTGGLTIHGKTGINLAVDGNSILTLAAGASDIYQDLDMNYKEITKLTKLSIYKAGVLIGWIIADASDRLYIKSATGHGMYLSAGNEILYLVGQGGIRSFDTNGLNLLAGKENINNVADPTTDYQAANKKYVDANGGGIDNVVEDTTPQLGGILDVNGHSIKELTSFLMLNGKTATHLAVDGNTVLSALAASLDVFQELDMKTHKIVAVVDPTSNQDAATKKYVDDNIPGAGTPVLTPSDVTGSRAFDTTYTNNTGYPMFVNISVHLQSGLVEGAIAYIHASADPPTTKISRVYADVAAGEFYIPLTFSVPAGWKYKVVNNGADFDAWIESTLSIT